MSPAPTRHTVLVTGGTSGIGFSCVRRLAAVGTRVVLTGREPATLAAAASGADDAVRIELDLAQQDAGLVLATELKRQAIALDGAVFAAGVNSIRPLLMESAATLDRVWRVNVW